MTWDRATFARTIADRACARWRQAWVDAEPGRRRAYRKAWRKRNRDHVNAYQREWWATHGSRRGVQHNAHVKAWRAHTRRQERERRAIEKSRRASEAAMRQREIRRQRWQAQRYQEAAE